MWLSCPHAQDLEIPIETENLMPTEAREVIDRRILYRLGFDLSSMIDSSVFNLGGTL
jgi:hypothetical protein